MADYQSPDGTYLPPEYDWALDRKLRRWRQHDGDDRRFYKSQPWRRLRAHVLAEFHWESYDEMQESPRRYMPAETVHHEWHVEEFPGMALSEFWTDEHGRRWRNLWPLSLEAHNVRHGRFRKIEREDEPKPTGEHTNSRQKPLTQERW